MLWIVVQGFGIFIVSLGPVVIVRGLSWSLTLVTTIAVGALMTAAIGLFDWSSRTMGRNWALVARTRDDASLIMNGPFAIIRNPIYLALGCVMIAIALALGHIQHLVLGLPVFALGTGMRVRSEEQLLRAKFGSAYDAYAAQVKRFVPGVF